MTNPLDLIDTPEPKQLGIFITLDTALVKQLDKEAVKLSISLADYVSMMLLMKTQSNLNKE